MKSKKRSANLAFPRQVAMYLAKNHTDFSCSKIGKFIGNKNHATVLHSCKVIEELLEVDRSFRSELKLVERNLKIAK